MSALPNWPWSYKVTKGKKLRTDGTVVESNIHPPSDSRQLADSVRVLERTVKQARVTVTSCMQGDYAAHAHIHDKARAGD